MESKENMVEKIYKSRYEINQESIKKQVENLIKNIEENNNIKNSIIMQEMYKQGFIDGVNLIMECKK